MDWDRILSLVAIAIVCVLSVFGWWRDRFRCQAWSIAFAASGFLLVVFYDTFWGKALCLVLLVWTGGMTFHEMWRFLDHNIRR